MPDTLFTKIIKREIPAQIVYEDDRAIAFRDIKPAAPTHILIVPKQPMPDLAAAKVSDEAVLGHLLIVAAEVARKEGIEPGGYRVVINNGKAAGQEVPHVHLHLLGGRGFSWPPG